MPSVAWQPRNDMNNQNGSKVTNSTICMGRGGGKEPPRNMKVEELVGRLSVSLLLGPSPTWHWRDFTFASDSKEESS